MSSTKFDSQGQVVLVGAGSNFLTLFPYGFTAGNLHCQEACRTDIAENRRLNYHLYEALRKSVYKPAAFYKGMLLPLASAGDCTLREASIFASVLARVRENDFLE